MTPLLAGQAFWLLGIDDQLRRPKAPHVRIGLAAAALVDVIEAGGAQWAGSLKEPRIELLRLASDDVLLNGWHERLSLAAGEGGCRAVFAIDALYEHCWAETARSLLPLGLAHEHRWPVLRRLSYAPTAEGLRMAGAVRDEARAALTADFLPRGVALTVVAAAESVGVSEYVLSEAWAADATIGLQATHSLSGNPLNRRLTASMALLVGAADAPGFNWLGL